MRALVLSCFVLDVAKIELLLLLHALVVDGDQCSDLILMLQRVEIWGLVLLDVEIRGLVLLDVTQVDEFVMASTSTPWNSLPPAPTVIAGGATTGRRRRR